MLSIGLVASASAAATYFLGNALGCQADYYLHPGGHSGRWIGSGAAALGLRGGLDAAGEWAFRLLLDGRDPHGERLVEPVLRADPRSLLPATPLVKAVRSAAAALGVPVPFLLDDRRLADRFTTLAKHVGGRRGVRVDHAGRLAGPTGRNLHSIYARPGSTRSGLVGRSSAAARIAVSNPLRGTRRLMLTTNSASSGIPKWARASPRSAASRGWNRSTSTPGVTTVIGNLLPAACSASAAG